jgi:hypothetical protein
VEEMAKAVAQFRKEATPDYDEADAKVSLMSEKQFEDAMSRPDNPFMKLSEKWDEKFENMYTDWFDRMMAIPTEEQRRELWPPDGNPRHQRP